MSGRTKKGAAPWPAEKVSAAMGTLYASSAMVAEELHPNFYAVSKLTGVPRETLQRWWKARDPAEDAQKRAAMGQRLAIAAEKGADEWGARIIADLHTVRARMSELVNDETRWRGIESGEAARALKTVAEGLLTVANGLKTMRDLMTNSPSAAPADTPPTTAQKEAAVRRQAAELGLTITDG